MTLKQWLQPVKTHQATHETHGKRFTNMPIEHWPSSEAEEAWPKINEHFDHNLTTSSILTFCDQNLFLEIKKGKNVLRKAKKTPYIFSILMSK